MASARIHGVGVNAENANEESAIHLAAKGGHVDILEMLIDYGVDVNTATKKLYTKRQWSDISGIDFKEELLGNADVAKVLVKNGANVNAVDWMEQAALHYAAQDGHVDVAKLLLQNGEM